MRNKWFCYIKINEQTSKIISSGMTFKEFIQGIKEKPNNILILAGYPQECEFNNKLNLEYINSDVMDSFLEEKVYDYGDFAWVDFKEEDSLKNVSEQELAELLYLEHKWRPLKDFQFNSLKNNYAYLCHDDDYIVHLYMKSVEDYKNVIQYKILSELKGRKRSIEPVPDTILDILYNMFKEGAVFDFENAYDNGVRIFKIGEIEDIKSIHSKLDKQRKIPSAGICLDYNPRSKKWTIYE